MGYRQRLLLDHKHRARRVLDEAIGHAADEAIIECRVPHKANNEQVKPSARDEIGNRGNGVPHDDVRGQLHALRLRLTHRQLGGGLKDVVGLRIFLDELVNRGREPRQFLDPNHMKFGVEIFRQLYSRRYRARRAFGAVAGDENSY